MTVETKQSITVAETMYVAQQTQKTLSNWLQSHQDDYHSWAQLGDAYYRIGDYVKARESYNNALEGFEKRCATPQINALKVRLRRLSHRMQSSNIVIESQIVSTENTSKAFDDQIAELMDVF